MIRGKQPEADLRHGYQKVFWISVVISALLHAGLFALFPSFEFGAYATADEQIIIKLEEIPETRQERRPPPPPRPVVPIATESSDVPDDATIETTDLDFDLDDIPPPPPLPSDDEGFDETLELEEEEDEVVELWKVEKEPDPKKRVVPEYPDIARRAGIQDKVYVLVLVGKDGKVEEVGQITGPEVFHEAARKAAEQWEFEPAVQNDRPVRVWVSLPFNFQLK